MPTLPVLLAPTLVVPQEAPADEALVVAPEEELRQDPGVRADGIDASAIEGVVQLEG